MLLAAYLVADAQDMKVKSFRKLDMDRTADLAGTSKMSANGTAALIKVVTFDRGFSFDGGTLGIVDVENKEGEIWVYVPPRAQKLTVSHAKYGVLREYLYDVPIESACTYELVLDPGVGKFVNITCGQVGATIYVDGEVVGESPVANHYLLYGNHSIKAVKNKMEGETQVQVTPTTGASLDIPMEDMSKEYARVTINVNNQAEIWYAGEQKAVGSWVYELRKGTYQIETRKEGCEPSVTVIEVKPTVQQTFNVSEPVPFHGYLTIHTDPRNVTIVNETMGNKSVNADQKIQVPMGRHILIFSKKGYVNTEKTYQVDKDQSVEDLVVLNRIEYVKSNTFYVGGGYTLSNLSGASIIAGGLFYNVNLEGFYSLGMGETESVAWYRATDNAYNSLVTYKMNYFGARVGYQIKAGGRFGFTPQVGFAVGQYKGTKVDGESAIGDGTSCNFLTFGCRVHVVPVQHLGIFITPQYMMPMGEGETFKKITESAGLTSGGISVTAGIFLNF